jgi:hypothetical protein
VIYLKLYFNITSMLVPGYPGTQGTSMYLFTVESLQPVSAMHTSCTQLLWKPRDSSREQTPIYLVAFETSRPVGARNRACTQLLRKPRHPGRQGKRISVLTAETSPCGQSRHTHLRIYLGHLKIYMHVYYNFVVVSPVIVKTRRICMYVYYTVVLVPGEP